MTVTEYIISILYILLYIISLLCPDAHAFRLSFFRGLNKVAVLHTAMKKTTKIWQLTRIC